MRGATSASPSGARSATFQLTLPVRGATSTPKTPSDRLSVSTHAPRAGSDRSQASAISVDGVSTHAPRAGSDGRILPLFILNVKHAFFRALMARSTQNTPCFLFTVLSMFIVKVSRPARIRRGRSDSLRFARQSERLVRKLSPRRFFHERRPVLMHRSGEKPQRMSGASTSNARSTPK